MAATDGVTDLDAAHVPDKTSAETLTGQWGASKPFATAGGFNWTANGDLETWNDGVAAAPTDWALTGAGATIEREGTNFLLGVYSAKLTRAGTDCYLAQNMATKGGPVTVWQSQPVIAGAWVKCSVASRARLVLNDGVGSTNSAYHTGGGGWEFLTVSATLNVAATKAELRLQVDTGNTNAYFDGVVFALGSVLQGMFWPSGQATSPAAGASVPVQGSPTPAGVILGTDVRTLAAAKTTVLLTKADAIPMNDGTLITGWALQSAAITAAGANGLDTGSEEAGFWYSIHGIRKSSDATKGLLLHKAPWFSMNTNFETGENTDYALRRVSANANTKLGQGFQVGVTATLPFVMLQLRRVGAVTAGQRVWVTIETDAAGKPSGTVLATSDEIDASKISAQGTTGHMVVFPFRTPAALTATTQYHIVLQGDTTASDTINIIWRGASAGGYANGSQEWFDGAVWTTVGAVDFIFRAFVDQGTAALTLPAGYDQYSSALGYAFNNAAGDFNKLVVRGRQQTSYVLVANKVSRAALAPAGADPVDVSSLVPPIPVQAEFIASLQVAGAGAFAPLWAVDADATIQKEGVVGINAALSGTTYGPVVNAPVPVEFGRVLVDTNTIALDLFGATVELP